MKITVATGLYPPEIGGPATHTVFLEQELPKLGYEVVVVPFRQSKKFPKILRHLHYTFRLLRASTGSSILFAQDVASVGFPALVVAKITSKKFVVRVPGDFAWEQSTQRFGVTDSIDEFQTKQYGWRVQFLRWIQNRVTKFADKVVTPSEYFRQLVIGWGVPSSQVVTIYNGVDLDIEQKTIVKPWPRLIVSSGRLVPWKGFQKLIMCLTQLPNWHLLIIGDGPMEQQLKQLVTDAKLSGRVHFTGNLSRIDVYSWCHAADVFVLNTHFESFSYQIVEAMDARVPVIATRVGSIPELITSEREGLLLEPDDEQGLVKAVKTVVEEPEVWRGRVAAAAKKVKEFDVILTAKRFDGLFKTLFKHV